MTDSKLWRSGLLIVTALGVFGCLENKDRKRAGVVAGAVASSAVMSPASGDVGIVEGVVVIEGDPAPPEQGLDARITSDCAEAHKTYDLLFREGSGRRVADVFVGVTGYQGTPGERQGSVPVVGRGCAWDKRTYALKFGQHLAVKSGDAKPYVPALVGTKSAASLVAVPNGDEVPVFAKGPGMYLLVDEMRNFAQATVLVVRFPTFDVTGLDGKFHIEGVPVGKSKISAMLPTVNLKAEQEITVSKSTTTRVELKLKFDAAEFAARKATSVRAPGAAGAPAS
jgi:hypothetical protein